MYADGPRRGRPTRSRLKVQRQQRSLAIVLVLSLVLFAGVEQRVTAGLGRDAAGEGDRDGGTEGGSAGGPAVGTEPVAEDGPYANDDGYDGWVDPASSGNPWTAEVDGLLTFRGNPTRSYYGKGPLPEAPEILWQMPAEGGFCGESSVAGQAKTWCGTGWTGQPAVWEDPGSDRTWVAIGAYDKNVHFLDADDGSDIIPPFDIGDIVKGSVTRDPDGFPLLYSGSRADFHIIATDREQPESLWSMDAEDVEPTLWNDDWDSSPLVIDDYLFEGGENSQFIIVKLNRELDSDGLVTVDPEVVFNAPGWDDELLADLSGSGTRAEDVSIENSLVVVGDTLYFTNSGGLVQGWDISGLANGEEPERTFRFWSGDDTDASLVADDEGMLYLGQEVERVSSSTRSQEVGQLVKLDPSRPDDPIVWSIPDDNGIWATPGLADGVVIAPTDSGRIIGADAETGEVLWEKQLPGPTWSSPVIVDDVWVQGDCNGVVHGFDLSDPRVDPPELWSVELDGCVESTPAVWDGRIFVGARGGAFYAIGDA